MPPTGGPFVASPQLLPGGRAVLFGLVDDIERVTVLDLETGEQKTLIENAQNATYVDTGHIVFARGTTLMAAPFDAAELALTGEPVALLQGVRHPNAQTAADYALSQTGTLVYVPGGEESGMGAEVVWVDRTGEIVGRAIDELVEGARDPRLSPDGRRLLLTTGLPNDGDLWSYDLGGRPPIPLALPGDNRLALWSPDGRLAAFTLAGAGGADLVTIPADGSLLAPIALRGDGLNAAPLVWSAANELVYLHFSRSVPNIGVTEAAASGELRDLVATEFGEFDAALSPNGRWLAYASDRTGRPEIWVKGYPDGVPLRVSRGGGYEPRWSADGRELYFLLGNSMMSVEVSTEDEFSFSTPQQLFAGQFFTSISAIMHSYDVAADGRFVMIRYPGTTAGAESASIVVVQNWTEELKRRVPSPR